MRYVIGDIHGCARTMATLIEKRIQPDGNTQLIFVGDYINKGPRSRTVLDYLISYKKNRPNTVFLKGNHEDNLVVREHQYPQEEFEEYVTRKQGSTDMLTNTGAIKPEYKAFLEELDVYKMYEDWIVVHAGLNLASNAPLKDEDAMLRIRDFKKDDRGFEGKRIIHGHQPTYQEVIETAVNNREMVIPIDNGCVYNKPDYRYDHTRMGNLCALNLDTFELVRQQNID